MADTGWRLPTTASTHAGAWNAQTGTAYWWGYDRIKAVDGSCTSTGEPGSSMAAGVWTQWLRGEGLTPTFPANAQITGIEVEFYLRRTAGTVDIETVGLIREGEFLHETFKYPNRRLTGSFESIIYGSRTDMWGMALTPSICSESRFGFTIQCKSEAASSQVEVDYARAKIYYNVSEAVTVAPAIARGRANTPSVVKGSLSLVPVAATAKAAAPTPVTRTGSINTAPAAAIAKASAEPTAVVISTNFTYIAPAATAKASADVGNALLSSHSVTPAPASAKARAPTPATPIYSSTTVPQTVSASSDGSKTGRIYVAIRFAPTPASARAGAEATAVRVVWDTIRLYPDFERNSQQSIITAFPFLITVLHEDLDPPLRYTDAGIDLASRGNAYEALAFDLRLPTNGRNQEPQGSLSIPIQSARHRGLFRTLTEPKPKLLIEMASGSDPDIIFPEQTRLLRMRETTTGNGLIVVALDDGGFEGNSFPPDTFDGRWTAVHD